MLERVTESVWRQGYAWVLGHKIKNIHYIEDVCRFQEGSFDYVSSLLPADTKILGICLCSDFKDIDFNKVKMIEFVQQKICDEAIANTLQVWSDDDDPLLCLFKGDEALVYSYVDQQLFSCPCTVIASNLPYIIARLQFNYPIQIDISLDEEFKKLDEFIYSCALYLSPYEVYVPLCESNHSFFAESSTTIESFYGKKAMKQDIWTQVKMPVVQDGNKCISGFGVAEVFRLQESFLPIKIGRIDSIKEIELNSVANSGTIRVRKNTVYLEFDILGRANYSGSVASLASMIHLGMKRQACQMRIMMQHALDHNDLKRGQRLAALPCFCPIALGLNVLTPIYFIPLQTANSFYRKHIHDLFELPSISLLRPNLSVDIALMIPNLLKQSNGGSRLINPHTSSTFSQFQLASGGIKHAINFLVSGSYAYFHYSQDGLQDYGWGCAYRSLQTLASWLLLQGYTHLPPPSFFEIQEILVSHDDKPDSFVNSKQWIGAIEVSCVLSVRYGVTCKILNISRGADLVNKARELARHFSSQGTPVMMGGGALAYTLLGIAWNESSGDVRFLILDPHYTGNDDLKTIVTKGWCSWHSGSLFDQNSFYNLCLLQRPSEFE